MKAILTLCLVPLLVSAPQAPAPAELVVATYDLAATAPRYHEGGSMRVLLPALMARGEDRESPEVAQSAYAVQDLLTNLWSDEFSSEGRRFDVDEHGIATVTAPENVQKGIERVLGFLSENFSRAAVLRVDLIDVEGGAPTATSIVPEREADKLVVQAASQGLARTYALRLAPGLFGTVEQTRAVRALIDYDVEVAQKAFAFDPQMATFAIGTQIVAQGTAVNGGIALSICWKDSREQKPVETRELRQIARLEAQQGSVLTPGPDAFQTPDVVQAAAALTTFVPQGQALVISASLSAMSGKCRQLVVLRCEKADKAERQTVTSFLAREDGLPLSLVDASALTESFLEINSPILSANPEDVRELYRYADRGLLTARIAQPDYSMVESMLNVDGELSTTRFGPWILVTPPDSRVNPDTKKFATLDAARMRKPRKTALVDIALTLRRTGAGGGEIARWCLPVLEGGRCAASIGIESLSLAEYDVEIAQGATVADPIVENLFDGLVLSLHPMRSADGALVIDLRACARLLAVMQRVDTGSGESMRIDEPSFDTLSLDQRVRFGADEKKRSIVLGEGSGATGRGGLALELEVR